MEESDKAGLIPNNEVPAGRFAKEEDNFRKKGISAEEAIEFLRIIQQSEFKVIEQLNKTPARISLLGLLMNSKPHWELLVKILNEAHVAQDISVEGFGGIINNITANRALHISVKCLDHIVAKVLIDNDFSLNVMPKTTLDKLPFNASHVMPSSMVVRAFNDNCQDVRGRSISQSKLDPTCAKLPSK